MTQVVDGAATVHWVPPGEAVTVKLLTGGPRFSSDGVHETVALASPATAVTLVGWPGSGAGVTGADGCDSGPAPTALIARTATVTVDEFDRSLMVHHVPGAGTVHVAPPGEAMASYPVIGDPPSDCGGSQFTTTPAKVGQATTAVGAPATVADPTGVPATTLDMKPTPTELVARSPML